MFTEQHHRWLQDFSRNLFGYACALCSGTSEAEDLYQEALVRAMSARAVPDHRRSFRVWTFRLMRNLWIDGLRRAARAEAIAQEEELTSGGRFRASEHDDATVDRLAVRQAFMQLAKDHRDVLALVDIGGFSYEETAHLLDIPRGTVMSRVSRARRALAQGLSDPNVIVFPVQRRRSL